MFVFADLYTALFHQLIQQQKINEYSKQKLNKRSENTAEGVK